MVSFLVLSFTIPSIIFGLYAGVCADRFSQKRIMYLANILRALIVLGYAYLGGALWYIFIAAFLISSAMQFFLPAEAARIPAIVKRENYMAANSLYIFTTYGALLFGYSLAGVAQLLGEQGQYMFISLFFLIAAISLSFLPYDKGRYIKISMKSIFRGVLRDLSYSWSIVKERPDIYMPILYLVFGWIAVSVGYVLLPSLANDILNINTVEISHLVIIPAGVGAITGAFIIEGLSKKYNRNKLIALGIFVMGAVGLLIATFPNFRELFYERFPEFVSSYGLALKIPAINILLFAIGFGAVFVIIPAQTLLQENTKDHLRGRVFGFLSVMINLSTFMPILVIGIIADIINMQNVMILISAIVLLIGFISLFYAHKRR